MMRTRSHPEASIAEGYVLDKSLTFCSRYMHGCLTRHNRNVRNEEPDGEADVEEDTMPYIRKRGLQLIGSLHVELDDNAWIQAHRYVLFNYDHIKAYKEYVWYL